MNTDQTNNANTASTDNEMTRLDAELPKGLDIEDCEITTAGALGNRVDFNGADVDDSAIVAIQPGWVADDGDAEIEYPWADDGAEAAQEYVDDGDWGNDGETFVHIVYAWRRAYALDVDGESVVLTIDHDSHRVVREADEPECDGLEHDWRSPYSLLGGIRENPGCWGHGGGVVIREVCRHCGMYRETDTWAQDECGQPYRKVSYEPADDDSLEWVGGLADEDE
jgi:hypothetical protein